jgi:hypothetical protein
MLRCSQAPVDVKITSISNHMNLRGDCQLRRSGKDANCTTAARDMAACPGVYVTQNMHLVMKDFGTLQPCKVYKMSQG